MRYAVCGMRYAVCGMRYAVCGMRYAVCGMRYAVCGMRYAVCRMPYAVCRMPYAVCRMPYAVCRMPYAACRMPYAATNGYRELGTHRCDSICADAVAVCGADTDAATWIGRRSDSKRVRTRNGQEIPRSDVITDVFPNFHKWLTVLAGT